MHFVDAALAPLPEDESGRIRALASEVDPTAIISNPLPFDEVRSEDANLVPWIILGAVALIGILLALSISGIYALMSFTVAERTREIGILVGIPVAAWLLSRFEIGGRIPTDSPFVLAFALGACVMVLIGMLACTAPALRALRIMPTEALRDGG